MVQKHSSTCSQTIIFICKGTVGWFYYQKNKTLTRIKAEVTGLLLDGHGMESSLTLGARRRTWGTHVGGDALLGVTRIDELLLEALWRQSHQRLRHLTVVRWPPVAGHAAVVNAAPAVRLGQKWGPPLTF